MRVGIHILLVSTVVMALAAGEEPAGPTQDSAPEIASRRVPLFNGKDLARWQVFVPDKSVGVEALWQVKNGVIHCSGSPNGYLRTKRAYSNYVLTVEWRWLEQPGNSGVMVHIQKPDAVWPKSIEAQLKSGDAGDFYVIGGTDFAEHVDKESRRVPKRLESNEKPIGQWNRYVIVCRHDTIQLYINGALQNEATKTTVTQGYIGLQSEGTPIEFRKIALELIREELPADEDEDE